VLRGKFALVIELGAAGLQFRIHAVPGACLGLAVSGGLAGGEPVGDVPAVRPGEADPELCFRRLRNGAAGFRARHDCVPLSKA
jgi:hypothetical protein